MNLSFFEKISVLFLAVFMTFSLSSLVLANEAVAVDESSSETSVRQRGFLLPKTQYKTVAKCEVLMHYVGSHYSESRTAVASRGFVNVEGLNPSKAYDVDILGCAIKTGDISLWMVVFFVRFFLEFVIGLAGVLAVAGVVYGGYLYLFAGISDDKDKGKNAIKNGLIGLVLTLTAWAIVNIVIALVTL